MRPDPRQEMKGLLFFSSNYSGEKKGERVRARGESSPLLVHGWGAPLIMFATVMQVRSRRDLMLR